MDRPPATPDASLRKRASIRMRHLRRRFTRWASSPDRFPSLEIAFAAIALVLGILSYAVLTGQRAPATGFSPQTITLLLVANLLPLLALLLLIARRIAILFANRRAGRAGAQLHVRLVALFAALAAAPTILVVIFASLLFQFGVQFWFSDRAKTVLDNADQVAQAYVDENKSRILEDIVAMGSDVSGYSRDFGIASVSFQDGLAFQVAARNLSEAAVFSPGPDGAIVFADTGIDSRPNAERLAGIDLAAVRIGEARAVASATDRIEAVVRLSAPTPVYIYVSRKVEPRVLQQVARTQSALSDYKALTERSRALQWRFNLILIIVSLLIVAVSIWFAILLASRLVAPIGDLAEAAERVGGGDFDARVKVSGAGDEIGALARAFNGMTGQLKAQQTALLGANAQSESRRRLIEAVLSGVSAGVLSVDGEGIIRLANASAEALLDSGAGGLVGRPLAVMAPELATLLEAARAEGRVSAEIQRSRPTPSGNPESQTLAVRLAADTGQSRSYILTFDDISQQLSDQRRAAWSDVARRIAHEIKNPLTPISLSAERLKRRFGPKITEGQDIFASLTDTIIRQVGDLRRMVDEFSAFARMPSPTFRAENIAEIARQSLFLAEVAQPAIRFSLHAQDEISPFICDRRQLGQAFTNLIKNAAESIVSKSETASGDIAVSITQTADRLLVTIEDSGIGIPDDLRDRLFEPYVTSRPRGTGLGLAIVKRIIDDHQGKLALANRPQGGAVARIEFDLAQNRTLVESPAPESAEVTPVHVA